MGLTRRLLPLVCGFALGAAPSAAAVLIHEYSLQGTLADNQGGPSLATLGGQITALGYVFAANQGLSLTSASLTSADFSMEFSFKLDDANGVDKLVDFRGLSQDAGLYRKNGLLTFVPTAASTTPEIVAGTSVHVVLTRDAATNLVVAYVNGAQRLSFVDTSFSAVQTAPVGAINFFVDDFATGQTEASGGTLNYLRVFNGALTAGEVSTLFSSPPPMAIPEPSTAVLLALGAMAVVLRPKRRRVSDIPRGANSDSRI